jgi:ankyrin repeat protein
VVQPPSPTILGTDELENSQSDAQASQLVYAVEQNYVERLTTLLDQHFDVNASTTEGLTALHQAVISQRQDLVPLLARAGANLNQYDTMGATPLLKCAESDHVEVAQRLLEAGADPNMQGDDFWRNETPLSACVRCKNVTLASILLKSGARLSGNAPPLREAVGKSDAELLRFLLAAGADFKEDGEHVLNWAAEANFADIAAFLCVIDDSNMFDRGKASQIALDNGWRRLGRHIRDRGFADASLSVIQHRGLRAKLMEMGKISKLDPDHTPEDLIEAVRNNDRLTVEMLLERGVNTNSDDAEAALELAISLDRSELIEILAAADAGSNQPAHLALRIAAQDGDAKLVRALLDAGADPDCRRTKPTPLSLALSGNKLEVIELLLNAGADPNGCGQSLHDASRNNWLEAVKLLINAGVNVNKVQQGSSLVDVAARRDHLEMVRLLLGAGANVISHSLNVWAIKQGHDDIIKFIQLIGNLEESYVDMYVDPRMITQQEAMMARGVLGQGGDDEDTLIADQGMRRQLIKLGKLSGSEANVGDRGQEVSGQSQEDDDDDKTIAH